MQTHSLTTNAGDREHLIALPVSASITAASTAKRHLVYTQFLESITLSDRDGARIERALGLTPDTSRGMLIRSGLDDTGHAIIPHELAKQFDFNLYGVPGFYYDVHDSPRRMLARLCGVDGDTSDPGFGGMWKINIPTNCLLKPYYTNRRRIAGLMIFANVEAFPLLLSSRGLPLGTAAAKPELRDLTLY